MVYIFSLYCMGKLTQIDRIQEWKMKYNNANVITKIFPAVAAGFNSWEMYRNLPAHLENKCCSLTEEQQIKAASFPEFVTYLLIWEPHSIHNHAESITLLYTLMNSFHSRASQNSKPQ